MPFNFVTPSSIENSIMEELRTRYDASIPDRQFSGSSKNQTRAVKEALAQIGRGRGYQSRYEGLAWSSQFLYDFVWITTSSGALDLQEGGYFSPKEAIKTFELAAEIEWCVSSDERYYDFQKLPLCRARLRCLLFYFPLHDDVILEFEALRSIADKFAFNSPGDRYLLGAHTNPPADRHWEFKSMEFLP